MAHLKGNNDLETLPMYVPSRLGATKVYGGDLKSTYDLHGHDDPAYRSRLAGHSCHKDFRINSRRNYRPWQFIKSTRVKLCLSAS